MASLVYIFEISSQNENKSSFSLFSGRSKFIYTNARQVVVDKGISQYKIGTPLHWCPVTSILGVIVRTIAQIKASIVDNNMG